MFTHDLEGVEGLTSDGRVDYALYHCLHPLSVEVRGD